MRFVWRVLKFFYIIWKSFRNIIDTRYKEMSFQKIIAFILTRKIIKSDLENQIYVEKYIRVFQQ